MVSRKDCFDDIAARSGKGREEVQDALEEILDRAEGYEGEGMERDAAYARARDEMLEQEAQQAMLRRRAEILDMRKESARHRYYEQVDRQIRALAPDMAASAPQLAIEAKLVGVNLPFLKGRLSVDAQYVAQRRMIVGGFARDLEAEGLLKIFASRALEAKWTDELFQLNRGRYGKPGLTRDAQALKIAEIAHKWQKASIDQLNAEGAWVRSYSGYITRTSHDADAIRAAGPEKWARETMPLLDLKRTFGTADRQAALDALRQMWTPLKNGDHFDYGKPIEEPIYPNVAKAVSNTRELHFRDAGAWRDYNDRYGVSNPTETLVRAMSTAARRTALLREFGSRPKEAFERDMAYQRARLQQETANLTSRLSALELARQNPGAPADVDAKIAEVRRQIADAAGRFGSFESWDQALRNRFAQIDGSSQRPVNRALSNTVSNWMAVQRMAKLGRVALTHFASLPTKAMEARYWGIPFAERYASLIRGLTQGAEGSDRRAALDATLVAFENRLGHMMAQYDVADAPAGFLTRWETTFFRMTGVSSVIDNQRGDAEAMFAAHVGSKRGQAWADIGRKEQRVLQGFGLGEAEWQALHGVEWTTLGDRTYLFPPDALKLSDQQAADYIRATRPGDFAHTPPGRFDLDKTRNDLATRIAAAYTDRAGFAVPMPSARIRAMLFGKNFEPGTPINTALKVIYQFKIWPADMIVRAWGRELYGTIGDGRLDRVAGLAEAAVGAIVFGVASEAVREAIQGQDSLAKIAKHPLAAIASGAQRSGFGSLLGDFLLGQFDRHGFSAVASLAGPTVAQIDTLMDLLHAGGETKEGEFSQAAMRQRGADLVRLARDNTPFMNLWATSWATNALIWNRLQEWIRPGYLRRSEQHQKDQRGTEFWYSPASVDDWLMGKRASPLR